MFEIFLSTSGSRYCAPQGDSSAARTHCSVRRNFLPFSIFIHHNLYSPSWLERLPSAIEYKSRAGITGLIRVPHAWTWSEPERDNQVTASKHHCKSNFVNNGRVRDLEGLLASHCLISGCRAIWVYQSHHESYRI